MNTRALGLRRVAPVSKTDETDIDLIAIHGLETGSPRTWEYDKTREGGEVVNWLSDPNMLQAAVPKVAVYTYDWDARSFESAPVQTLLGHADNLLASVARERGSQGQHGRDRPIIFISSCFGGLILAEAICRAAQEGSAYRDVMLATVGAIFLATPFRGSDAASQARWLVTVKGIMGEESSDQLIRDLEASHDFVHQRVQRFAEIAHADSMRLPVRCFYETQKTELLRKLIPRNLAGRLASRHTNKLQSHFIVPFGRNASFVGRGRILDQLLERIPPSADKDDCQRTAIEGLGGIGKTQIALEAAYRVHEKYPDCSVFWVPAIDLATLDNAYRRIGHELKVPGIEDDKADPKVLVSAALSSSKSEWLLIIDNADDTRLLFSDMAISGNLPFNRKGSILFTTRSHQAVVDLGITARGIIDTAEMTRSESLELLSQALHETQMDNTTSTSMNSLLEILADLPLAVQQASSYMAKTGISVGKYLDYCQISDNSLIKLLSKDFEDSGRYKTIKNPIATTWLISFQQIERESPLSARYLKFLCFLAEKDIPMSLLPPGDDELEAVEAIGTLKAYGFIAQRRNADFFDIHRLVRLATQNSMEQTTERSECVTCVIQQLAKVFIDVKYENREQWIGYLPHAESALGYQQDSKNTKARSDFLSNVARSYYIAGRYQEAERLWKQVLELKEKTLGRGHPSTLASIINLARVLGKQKKWKEAEEMCRPALDLGVKVRGRDHPETVNSMVSLAVILRAQGQDEMSRQILQQVQDLREKTGREHPDRLYKSQLVAVLAKEGRYEEAEKMCRQVLRLREREQGREHYETFRSMSTLAYLLGRQRKDMEAEQIHRETLALREKVLGQEHPDTLDSMNYLAVLFGRQGRLAEAEQLRWKILDLREKVLGREHPDTLDMMDGLANILGRQGKLLEAEEMLRQMLDIAHKVLDRQHPLMLKSTTNLRISLQKQGKAEEAKQVWQQECRLKRSSDNGKKELVSEER